MQRFVGEEPAGMASIGPPCSMSGSGGGAGRFHTTAKPEKEPGSKIPISSTGGGAGFDGLEIFGAALVT